MLSLIVFLMCGKTEITIIYKQIIIWFPVDVRVQILSISRGNGNLNFLLYLCDTWQTNLSMVQINLTYINIIK
jgi:hypothetical protein